MNRFDNRLIYKLVNDAPLGSPVTTMFPCNDSKTPILITSLALALSQISEHLTALWQEGTIKDFNNEIVVRVSQVIGLPKQHYLWYFLNRLKPKMWLQIHSQEPRCYWSSLSYDFGREIEWELWHAGITKLSFHSQANGGRRWSSSTRPVIKPISTSTFQSPFPILSLLPLTPSLRKTNMILKQSTPLQAQYPLHYPIHILHRLHSIHCQCVHNLCHL